MPVTTALPPPAPSKGSRFERMMASVAARRSLPLALLVVAVSVTAAGVAGSKSFTITNDCSYTVWPGILSGAASTAPPLDSTGFELAPGESRVMPAPSGWSGLVWGRTLCSSDAGTGKFTCVTGDCGSGKQDCAGGGPAPPATIAEFTLDSSGGMDFYDISIVNGFNLPMLVAPQGENCATTGCVADLNGACPAELRVESEAAGAGVVACNSACQAFGSPQYCCTGAYGTPNTCNPSAYSELFKKACPLAVSYAFDGAASTFTCAGGDTTYTITFCPIMPNSGYTPPANQQPTTTMTPSTAGSELDASSIALITGVLALITAAIGLVAKLLGVFKNCRCCC